ncbi:metal-dependent transcriptional regulator [Streptomyces sp. SHP 1-2]|uniref:metal-dependent transcriptional regulator n=1 Tax=Streptomyces sp. SHP 1-2 TaxID=2769489 RepID=UPI002237547E|nr:metal-dependent transcriptional regulator [Streptomyces sp. SHP 1-2]MCW5254560.1 metal-dependent transcriptional regulator [Streptomyces sp. SHP 1-2]
MTALIDTTEMYLRTVYELEEEGVPPLRARIAERLGHSGPTVSQTVARLRRDGLVRIAGDRRVELTAEGGLLATRVMRRHRLAECLLVEVIGLEWELAHVEACRWEHVITDAAERRIAELLRHPERSPYGNPIPAPDGPGGPGARAVPRETGLVSLAEVDPGPRGRTVVVRRLGEPLQSDPGLMHALRGAGVEPGAEVRVTAARAGLLVGARGGTGPVSLSDDDAPHVLVARPTARVGPSGGGEPVRPG